MHSDVGALRPRSIEEQNRRRAANLFGWIVRAVEGGGFCASVFSCFAENIFPPNPSEVIMPFVELWRGQVHFHQRSGCRRHRVACRSALVGSATISSRSFPHATTVGLAVVSRSLICQVLGSRAAAGGCRLCGAHASRPARRPVQRKASSVVVRRAGKPHPSNAGAAHCRAPLSAHPERPFRHALAANRKRS